MVIKMNISVLMSVYKKEKAKYLKESIDSVLNQTLFPDQIVIIKDGKLTKQLDDVLNQFKSKYPNIIEIYEIKESCGLGLALNLGINKCRNDYIARMDSDDCSLPNRFELQAKIFEENPNLDILGGYIEEYDEELNEFISIRKVPTSMQSIKKYIKTQSPFNHTTVMYKKDAVIRTGGYNNVKLEDYDLWARMLINNCLMQNIDQVLCKARTGKSLYKRRSGIKQVKKVLEIEKKLLQYKIIGIHTYIMNVILRSILAFLPINIKKIVYINIIRKLK